MPAELSGFSVSLKLATCVFQACRKEFSSKGEPSHHMKSLRTMIPLKDYFDPRCCLYVIHILFLEQMKMAMRAVLLLYFFFWQHLMQLLQVF